MTVTLNGQLQEVPEGSSILQLLLDKGLDPNKVVVELNCNLVKRKDWENTILQSNDTLEVLSFVGGG